MSFTTWKRPTAALRVSGVAIAAVAALLLSGCGGTGTADAGPPEALDADPTAPEVTTIRGAGFRAPLHAPFMVAETEGIAAEYGLTLEPLWTESASVAVSTLVAGDADAALSSLPTVISAAQSGIDLRIVAGSYINEPGSLTLEAMPDSGITSPADLIGKTVNVTSLNSGPAVKLRDTLLDLGLNPDDVDFVELPYGEVPAALEQGTVDASNTSGASRQIAKEVLGTVTVIDFGDGKYRGMPEGGWTMTQRFIDANPNTVAAFQCTIIGGAEIVNEDDEIYRAYLRDTLEFNEDAVAADVKNTFGPIIEMEGDTSVQLNADLMERVGILSEPFDLASLVIPPPDNC